MSSLFNLDRCLKTTYALTEDRNFENFLSKIGVAKEARRRAINLKPTIRLTKKKDNYTLTTNYGNGNVSKITFELDKPIVRKLMNGGVVTSLFVAKDENLVETQLTEERTITVTRTFSPTAVTVTMKTEKDGCKRFYKKVPKPDSQDIRSETSRRSVATSETSDTTGETFATESEIEIRNIVRSYLKP